MFRPYLAVLALLSPASLLPLQAQSNNLFVNPTTLTFNGNVRGLPTGTQTISASSSTLPIGVNVDVEYIGSASGWLHVDVSGGITPFNVNVYADPTNLTVAATYSARVNFRGSFGATVFVNFNVGASGGASPLTVSPSTIFQSGSSSGPAIAQQLNVASTNASLQAGFTIATSTTSGGNWLTYYSPSGFTPALITVTLDPTNLPAQTYTGSVIITPTSGGTPVTIPVTLNVNGVTSGFALSQTNIPVSYQIGTSYPPVQTIFVNNTSGQISYTATSSASWAQLYTTISPTADTTTSGLTGSALNISINPSGLTAGQQYPATITFTASTGQTLYAYVNLNVTTSGFFNINPSALTFTYQPGNSPPTSQNITVNSSTGSAVNFTATAASNGNWLNISTNFGNTSTSNVITVSIAQVVLTNSTYSGTITITDPSSQVSTTVPVTLNYGTSGGTNQLNITPNSVFFQAAANSPAVRQTIQVAAYSGVSQNFQVSASSTTNWLSVAPGVGVTPATITVVAVPALVSGAGTYTGNLTFTNFDGTQQVVPVTFNVTSNVTLAASPNSLSFTQAIGAPAPAATSIQISAANGPNTNFTVSSNSSWLTVSPTAGSTPGSISVSVTAANLTQGNYSGQITIVGGINQLAVPVSFTVLAANTLTLSSTSLNFNYQAGGAAITPQTINVTSTGASVPFISASTTSIGGNWLSVSQSANGTPATVTVTVNPVSLSNGIYPGAITISASDGSGQKITVNVNLTVTAPPAPQIATILNSATQQPTWLSPGLIVVIQGSGLGPANVVNGTLLAPGAVDTIAGGTRILFDGVPAAILAAKSDGVLAVVPYGVSGKSTVNMIVEYQGIQSAPFSLGVFDSAPGIYTRDGSGAGQAAVVNIDGSQNSPANPAAAGSIVSIYATGEGNTRPMGQDGRVIVTDLRVPLLPVRLYLNGRELEILYAGSAPGFVSGAFQVNVRIPADLAGSGSLPIELQVGVRASQPNITIAIR
jgi:uncharacterized protein (TIGR03437 family)